MQAILEAGQKNDRQKEYFYKKTTKRLRKDRDPKTEGHDLLNLLNPK